MQPYMGYFNRAYNFTLEQHSASMEWISNVCEYPIDTPEEFMDEYAYVVNACGWRGKYASIVCEKEKVLTQGWTVLPDKSEFLKILNNKPKAATLIKTFDMIKAKGWSKFKREHLSSIEQLKTLGFIGDITKWHLGRNIGLAADAVKPDLHLVRLAGQFKFATPQDMVEAIARIEPMKLGVIDFCLWCYASHVHGKILDCCGDKHRLR